MHALEVTIKILMDRKCCEEDEIYWNYRIREVREAIKKIDGICKQKIVEAKPVEAIKMYHSWYKEWY